MIFFDALFRFSAIGLLFLLGTIAWRARPAWRSRPYLVLSCVSVGALYAGYAPPALLPPKPILIAVRLLDIPHLVFVWLFALSLFNQQFRLRPHHILIGLVYCAPILWIRLGDLQLLEPAPRWMIPIGSATSIALIGHLIWVTLKGRRDDLLERRRAVRIYFILTISLVAVAAALSDLLPPGAPLDRRTAKAVVIWPAIIFGCLWMLSFDRLGLSFGALDHGANAKLNADDQRLREKLVTAMEGGAYRNEGLTIAQLASEVGVGQHKLRSLINASLGFANFSTFLASYRIEDVKKAMANPAHSKTPILTLALDGGFKSLSPFNKAFKDITGMTPSEYRKGLALGSHNFDEQARNPSEFPRNPQDAAGPHR